MRALVQITLICLLAGGAMAQRHGGGGMGGGFHGGGSIGAGHGGFTGGGFTGGGFRGGNFGGGFNGFRGGIGINGFRGGFGGFRGFRGGFYGGYWPYGYYPYWGLGYGYWPDYYDSYYPYNTYTYNPYGSYASYDTSPNVTVVYPQTQASQAPVYVERPRPVSHEYDEYGQEIHSSGTAASSPIYLVAFKDHVIRAAASYWVDGRTLHYVTLQHEEKQVPLDSVDRDLSMQLNRERRVQFQLPQ